MSLFACHENPAGVMRRRRLLRMGGAALATAFGAGVVTADGDVDPRPVSRAGTKPNPNVPVTETGALGRLGENSEIPVGDWIAHSNGWTGYASKAEAKAFADGTKQTYIIDDTVLELSSFDDWEFAPGTNELWLEYVTPPKPTGTTYEVRWEFEAHDEAYAEWEAQFPYTNEVRVGRN